MKPRTLYLLLLAALSSYGAMGQINCASGSASRKLVCEFPFATGVLSNANALGGQNSAASNAVKLATTLNVAIATQASQLPLATASAGVVLVYRNGVPETFNNLGPILTDRAQTIGARRMFFGVTASQFVFTDIDGSSLSNLPFAYSQVAYAPGSTSQVVSTTYTTETTSLSFRADQLVAVATLGLTKRIDYTVIVPIERVSLGATTSHSQSYVVSASTNQAFGPVNNPQTYTAGTASGVGDITVNVKAEIWGGERGAFSTGMNLRAPTGDELNFLGSGAWGFNPYLVYSYLAKVSPHAKVGYEWNSDSDLNNPTLTAHGNQALPGGMQYDIGADWAMQRHWTFAADLQGNQYLNTPRLVPGAIVNISTASSTFSLATSTSGTSSYSINNVSTGVKWNPAGNLVISANLLTQINNNGLRSRPTPLVGISYKF
ncbi:MAG TPA: transporter [Terracidiphilus sp.]|nr:transporter [Terracidiphilus sp.]